MLKDASCFEMKLWVTPKSMRFLMPFEVPDRCGGSGRTNDKDW
jgi:hypothetical protein